ncbi:macrolide ABC transporter ATP-binding protein [Candidatus Woesebacteria bacterium RIFCSPHIGHO2_02_FULL_38_9]|uniref:Macrolide ABC transporter ATP-binding protein n=1 Tax=Candidatus Woesebacteria bacterium RIFCSPHIGHO2_01_FULL_39_28 TaxID=1802496 RepID=A0A1F7YJ17_9BACT|nr:MAG: macrolide ABC transporter ATP-binding protein [Candidatus Woesebacteria bacterium RIFCSPHIGHO2_01_FULL_39_28]OGM31760.1 MAG: macrolide ABC transporter ATP-binding protein [Candidatus Woesebacteria bacterium RIFCSPHIGHO2_02_FULL_38_9]OGM57703.1 MAG: macrolide ABC transporter ATP-binding protein [Candidatus Woesebacteria bacterium RIFCSPLOWO2_01_FULL_38_20]
MSSVIVLENISKIYPMGEVNVGALENISLEIKKQEFVAIVGPSGSGKSTLMHIIGLLDEPTSGKVFLEDRDISNLSEKELAVLRNKHIGFIFQTFNLLPKTSALNNVELPLIYAGIVNHERTKMAVDALEKVDLGQRLDHFPSQLSGGQQQRVAIARALVNNPTLILADEPTGNLDSKSGKEILDLLINLNNDGNTIVLVTHDMSITGKAKRLIQIVDGRIVSDKRK